MTERTLFFARIMLKAGGGFVCKKCRRYQNRGKECECGGRLVKNELSCPCGKKLSLQNLEGHTGIGCAGDLVVEEVEFN